MKRILRSSVLLISLGALVGAACNDNKKEQDTSVTATASSGDKTTEPAEPNVNELFTSEDESSDAPAPLAEAEAKKEMRPATATASTGRAQGAYAMKAKPKAPSPMKPAPVDVVSNSEDYKDYGKNPLVDTSIDRLSTFAVDVDTASYTIARRKIVEGHIPPASSVRVEEFLNYFGYQYQPPTDGSPFAVHMDMAPSPFQKGRHLLRVGVKAKEVAIRDRKSSNLVFLVDVSGSMSSPDKLGLAKRALRILVNNLKDGDTVSLVTYAGNTRVVLEPTDLSERSRIESAIEDLNAGGSTAMSSGMELAYELAAKKLGPDSNSRVIVLSDGDANVGNTSHEAILKTISAKVKEGVTMSTIGFGMGNYKDTLMEQLANKGNGNYYYIDGYSQAKRVFQEELGGTLEVVAKDTKIQVDFDPEVVKSYRLVGYENRDIADSDFRNDKVDAGEIGAGHSVTAMYEVVLKKKDAVPATVRIRAKAPKGSKAKESAHAFDLAKSAASFDAASADFRFATAVMGAAEILRESEHAGEWSMAKVIEIARQSSSADSEERQEFISLMEKVLAQKGQLASR